MAGIFPDIPFTENDIPQWSCPACQNASLEPLPGSFATGLSAYSKANRDQDWYFAEDEEYVFTCMLQCSRRSCKESVAVSGFGCGEIILDERLQEQTYQVVYRAKSFVPPLPVFSPPESCPDDVRYKLKIISALLPVSGTAAINAMRSVLEDMLDHLSVPKTVSRENREPLFLTLHKRIDDYPKELGNYQSAFMALKWLGNAGSHGRELLKKTHIQEACEVLDDLIQRLYGRDAMVAEKVARLLDAHAPKKPTK